jgi:hypothetical protein
MSGEDWVSVRRIHAVRFRRRGRSFRRGIVGFAEQPSREALSFSKTLNFNRDSIDGVLDSLETLVQSRIAYVAAASVL